MLGYQVDFESQGQDGNRVMSGSCNSRCKMAVAAEVGMGDACWRQR